MSLLCGEDCNSFVDEGEGEVLTPVGISTESMAPVVTMADESLIAFLMEKECQFSPREDYLARLHSGGLNVSARNDSVEWICKVVAHYHFAPLTACLSVNYLDRFLSEYALPEGKSWMVQLLSVACLSVAAKMEETDVPLPLDLQVGESKFVFEPRTIQRMELLLLNTLKWKMNAVTPLSFIDFFLYRITHANPPALSLVSKTVELILTATKGIEFLEFLPSEIALAASISATSELLKVDFMEAVDLCSSEINKDRVLKCYELIQEVLLVKQWWNVKNVGSGSSVPGSPAGVLEAAACLSYESSKKAPPPSSFGESPNVEESQEAGATATGLISCGNNYPSKRRKIQGVAG
ncbi:cyclin-D4-1-like [Nymphaea colorata]|nr:cyclin-D4-1-like [Nymphaea colorata]